MKPTRQSLLFLAAIVVGVLCSIPSPAVRATTAQANEEANTLGRLLAEKQVRVFGIRTGYVGFQKMTTLDATLEADEEFIFVCGGCLDAYDVDMAVFDKETEELLGRDTDDTKLSVVSFRTSKPTKATVVISMANSTRNGAHFALLAGKMPESAEEEQQQPATPAKIDLATVIKDPNGSDVTLREMMGGNKALYIRVWSSWCGPCKALVPTLAYRERVLGQAGIKVMTLNNELGADGNSGGDLDQADLVMSQLRCTLPAYAETSQGPIVRALGIDSVPRTLIVGQDGTVLYNGHPLGDSLPKVLETLDVKDFDNRGGLP